MEENNYMEEHIRRSLGDYELQPDVQSFHTIMQQIDKEKKRRRFVFFLWSGIGCLLLLSAAWFLLPLESTGPNQILSQNKPAKQETVQSQTADKSAGSQAMMTAAQNETIETKNKTADKSLESTPVSVSKNTNNTGGTSKIIINKTNPKYKKPVPVVKIAANGEKLPAQDSGIKQSAAVSVTPIEASVRKTESVKDSVLVLPSVSMLLPWGSPGKIAADSTFAIQNWDSLIEKRKRVHFYFGLSFNPQLGALIITPNRNRQADPVIPSALNANYDEVAYINERKDLNKLRFHYAYGLKLGMNFRNRYEVQLGYGYQRFSYRDNEPGYPNVLVIARNEPLLKKSRSSNVIKVLYQHYSVEGSKIFTTHKGIRLKTGLGVYADYAPAYLLGGRTLVSGALKTGILWNAGRRWQFQLCPSLYGSFNSMLSRQASIAQRPWGVGMEGVLLFRLY